MKESVVLKLQGFVVFGEGLVFLLEGGEVLAEGDEFWTEMGGVVVFCVGIAGGHPQVVVVHQ